MAEEETVLHGTIDRLIEIGKCYEMEMNAGKTKVMRVLRQPYSVHITINQKQWENVGCFNCLGSMVTSDARCTREVMSSVAVTKATPKNRRFSPAEWTEF